MKTCSKCNIEKEESEYHVRKGGRIYAYCKDCHRDMVKTHYSENKGYYKTKAKVYKSNSATWYRNYKDNLKCEICDEAYSQCLEFHHKDPNEKEFTIANMARRGLSVESLKEEIDKCAVVCANCHRKLHGGLITLVSPLATNELKE